MRYIYEDWGLIPNTVRGRIEVDYKRNGDTHTIKLIKFDVRYPNSFNLFKDFQNCEIC